MPSIYPAQIDNNTSLPDAIDSITPVQAEVVNRLKQAIIAVENALGTKPYGLVSTVSDRIADLETAVNTFIPIALAKDLGGTPSLPQVVGIRGRLISTTIPTSGQSLVYNGSVWTPMTISGGGGSFTPGGDLAGSDILQTVISLTGDSGIVTIPTASLAFGAFPPVDGYIRFDGYADTSFIKLKYSNGTDYSVLKFFSGAITLGDIGLPTRVNGDSVSLYGPGSGIILYNTSGTGYALAVTPGKVVVGQPMIGYTTDSSPYGVHGVGTQAMADADQTVAAAVYCYNTIRTTDAITANRTITIPSATDAAGYTKIIDNTCTGAFSIIVSTGAGTTAIIDNGYAATVLVDATGVTVISGNQFTPTTHELSLVSGLFTTTSTSFTRIGARKIDLSSFPATVGSLARVVTFKADVDMTATATSVEVQLYDITNAVVVTGSDLTSSSTTNTEVTATLTAGSSSGDVRDDSPSQYEVQLKMNGGLGADAVFCTNARLIISYA